MSYANGPLCEVPMPAEDVRLVLSRIPKDIREIIVQLNLTVAGGFIRSVISGERISDLDLFGPSVQVLETAASWIEAKRQKRAHRTKNAITIALPGRLTIQLITRWTFATPADALASFDFTIAQACLFVPANSYGETTWAGLVGPDFYRDLAAKRLRYTCPARDEDPGGSLMRVRKFLARGYTIQPFNFAAVIVRLLKGIKGDDIIGFLQDERHATQVLTGLLREVDPSLVIDGIEPADEPVGDEVGLPPVAPADETGHLSPDPKG